MGQIPLVRPLLSPSSTEGEELKASHIPVSLLPEDYWSREAFPHMYCHQESEGFGILLEVGTNLQGWLDQLPGLTCVATCTLLIFQWFLSIAFNGVVPPGNMRVHSVIYELFYLWIMKDSASITHCYTDFLYHCTHMKPTNKLCSSMIPRSTWGI